MIATSLELTQGSLPSTDSLATACRSVARVARRLWPALPPRRSAAEPPYTQTKNVVFAEVDGVGLVLDVFTPTGAANGLGIVDVASGAFYSDRGKIEDHRRAQMYDIFCGKGYTVFAVRPGSITKFTLWPRWPRT